MLFECNYTDTRRRRRSDGFTRTDQFHLHQISMLSEFRLLNELYIATKNPARSLRESKSGSERFPLLFRSNSRKYARQSNIERLNWMNEEKNAYWIFMWQCFDFCWSASKHDKMVYALFVVVVEYCFLRWIICFAFFASLLLFIADKCSRIECTWTILKLMEKVKIFTNKHAFEI